jgi:hypothetical protein
MLNSPEGRSPERSEGEETVNPFRKNDKDRFHLFRLLFSGFIMWKPTMRCNWLAAVLLILLFASPAVAEKRVALVIGNSAYQSVSRLENPKNDALLVAETLSRLGFTLVGGGAQVELDKPSFDSVVQRFGSQLIGADVALFYYAGHGLQVRGTNYLVPVTANPTRETDVDFQMVDVSLVLRQMEGAGTKLNHRHLRCLQEQSVRWTRTARLRWWASSNPCSGRNPTFLCDPAWERGVGW